MVKYMKIEINLIKNKIKVDKNWILVILSSFIVTILYCQINYKNVIPTNDILDLLIGNPFSNYKDDFVYLLFNLCWITYVVYITISYFNYEFEYFSDNLILREKSKSWFRRKIASILILNIILKLINIVSSLIIFGAEINYYNIMISIIFSISISLISIIINCYIKNNTLSIILSLASSLLIFYLFNKILIVFVISLILCLITYKYFSLRKLYRIKFN